MNFRSACVVLVLTLVLVASTDALAQQWGGITEAENRIVFAGRELEEYRVSHRFHPFDDSANSHEHYRARWETDARRLPVFWADLFIAAPGRYFSASRQNSLAAHAKGLGWFKDKPFRAIETGIAGTAMGPADFLVFTADKHRCGFSRLYFDDGTISDPDSLGGTRLVGLYCPVSGQVDAGTFEALLSKVGVRGIGVPKVEAPRAARGPASHGPLPDSLATLVTTGDIKGLRRVAAKNFDPDTIIPFQHPRFARGRLIRRPMLVAAALFGQTESVVFLLNKGASTRGPSGGAICAAIARRHSDIVDVLLKKDPELRNYNRCGQSRTMSPLSLARRLDLHHIVDKLLETNSR